MSRLFFLISSFLSVQLLSAQVCGTLQEPLLERVDLHKKSLVYHQRGAVKYIPITFHLVANAAGTGRVQEEKVLNQLCTLNEQFRDQDAVFYIDRLNYFDNDAVYETPASSAATLQMRLRRDNNSMNIYITNKAESNNEGPGQTLAYYDPQEDWVVTRKDQVGSGKTLAHEIGHFFGLPHTFSGWECNPYTVEDYGNPVNLDYTLPCSTGGGAQLIEFKNGSNCAAAGDHICDTPADYNLPILFDPGCDENTLVKDKNGEVIMPMITNFMSYYSGCDTNVFTPMQQTLMNTDFFSPQRHYIRTGKIPNQDSVEAPVVYITPINGELTPGFTNILFDWQDTPGATHYLVYIARNNSFTLNLEIYTVTESQLIVDELPLNTFYWKVFPYNESQTCAGFSATQNFKVSAGTGVNEIADINDYVLSPNPIYSNESALLSLTSSKSFDAILTVTDASGQRMSHRDLVIPSGVSEIQLETQDLVAGIYFVMLKSKQGTLVERLLVLE